TLSQPLPEQSPAAGDSLRASIAGGRHLIIGKWNGPGEQPGAKALDETIEAPRRPGPSDIEPDPGRCLPAGDLLFERDTGQPNGRRNIVRGSDRQQCKRYATPQHGLDDAGNRAVTPRDDDELGRPIQGGGPTLLLGRLIP